MQYFLGIDVGGSKTHALITDQTGSAIGFAQSGPGNWEGVGYDGLTNSLKSVITQALKMSGKRIEEITGTGMGIAGFDWPSQKQAHLDAISPIGLGHTPVIVNDAVLGIAAGTLEGWGISIVSGTGCNCRGISRDRKRQGRVVGGAPEWSGEAAGGFDILARAMRAVVFEWTKRGPATTLSTMLIQQTGARDLADLIEGVYTNKVALDPSMTLRVFDIARHGDPEAVEIMRWSGEQLGEMAVGVIHQLELEQEKFEVVLIGSIFDGHPLITESLISTIRPHAPNAQTIRLNVPPVIGGVLLGMQSFGLSAQDKRERLIETTRKLINK